MLSKKVYDKILKENNFEYSLFFKEDLKAIFNDIKHNSSKNKLIKLRNEEDLSMIMDYLQIKLSNKKIDYVKLVRSYVFPFINIYTTDGDSITITASVLRDFGNKYIDSFINYINKVKLTNFHDIFKTLIEYGSYTSMSIVQSESEEYIDSEKEIEYSISKNNINKEDDIYQIHLILDELISKYRGQLSRIENKVIDIGNNVLECDIILEKKDYNNPFIIHIKGKELINKLIPKLEDIEKDLLLERERRINRREFYYGKFNNGQNS